MHAYNPRKKNYQQLDSSLVGAARRDFLNAVIKELSLQAGESPKQHWLVVGPRGIGKSHLLTLLYHKLKMTPELSRLWIPVLFPEETRMESNLAKFLERAGNEIIHELKEIDQKTAEAIRDKIAKTRTLPVQERDDYLFSVLSWITETTGKYILFITENLQHLLGKKLSLLEQKKLRAFLQTTDAVTLLGSATTVFNALHDHSHPFYNFFHIHRLTDLSFDDMKVLIGAILTASGRGDLAERLVENEARIKALSVFTGGNPRMAVFLADILKTDVPEEMLDLMDGILDELTPYFETIFKDIPDYLEAVINTLAAFEPAQSPTEITAHLEGQSTTIRNYLKQLKDGGYVRVAFSRGRSNYYCLNEYLYRIWFQMRDSGHREETRWLLELLLMLYSPVTLLEEKERVEGDCRSDEGPAYSRLIVQAADFMVAHPDYCRVIEWCVASAKVDEEKVTKTAKDKKIYTKISKLITAEEYDKAVLILQDYLKDNPDVAWAYGLWGECLRRQYSFEQAIEKFKKAIGINQESTVAYWYWGDCLRDLGRHDEAIEKFAKTAELDPESYPAYGAWGDCLKKLGQYVEAEKKYETAITIEPKYFDAYVAWGDCLRLQDRYDEAIEQYKRAAEVDPKSEWTYWGWGYCLRSLGRFDEAIEKFAKEAELDPEDYAANGAWGDCLKELRRYAEAEKKYETAITIEPKYIDAYRAWGDCLRRQGRYDEAMNKFNKALELNPNDSSVYRALGVCLSEQEKNDEAIRHLKKAIELDPKDYVAYAVWGDCLKSMEKFLEADEKYQQAVALNPSYADAYGAWGCSLKAQKRFEEALEKYQKAFEYDPDSKPCGCFIECLRQLKRFDEAIDLFKKHHLNQGNCSTIFDYGNLLLEAGRYEEAGQELANLLKRKKKCTKAYLPYGRALAALSDQEGALTAYLNYLKSNLENYVAAPDFQTLYQEELQLLLAKMTPGPYIEKLYTPAKVKDPARARNCMILVLFGKYEIVREHIPVILAETNMKNKAQMDALELLFFAIKFMAWINLCLEKIHEALNLTGLYGAYIKSLPLMNKKETEVRSLALGLLKLQVAKNIAPESTGKIFLQLAADPDIPFADVLLKVLTCISEPDSLQSQQFLSDKIIAEVVKGLSQPTKKKKSICDSCGSCC
jgi:tetratricopeptide (TPR) repeat protein